jgi:hypothetical protein
MLLMVRVNEAVAFVTAGALSRYCHLAFARTGKKGLLQSREVFAADRVGVLVGRGMGIVVDGTNVTLGAGAGTFVGGWVGDGTVVVGGGDGGAVAHADNSSAVTAINKTFNFI